MDRFTLRQMEAFQTLSQGQYANLKVNGPTLRVWLARVGKDDGAPYDNGVTVERLINGKWTIVDEYEAVNEVPSLH